MFYADLHVHSKYSRATSRDCDLEHLYFWARKKGIGVVGTGDFTHPAWLAEIRDKLVPAEPGLFRLRDDLERALDARLKTAPIGPTRFMLSVEISNIYKRADKTRKVHNLIYAPDLESAERFAARLERIGNIRSDGRPILGLDSRDLLEIALESGPGCYLVPAHVWTPWFAVLGSKSGFDEVEACYADLAPHIFALETGLSSDPAMNWRLSQLDRYRLVSNSDAHSPPKLGREATAFDTELDYFAIRRALETGHGFGGTVEFFPEEGKYHLDGHRKCNVCLPPEQSLQNGGLCPVCHKPLTLGVLHRVAQLADRPDGARPEGAAPFDCLVPLPELLAETLATGVASQKVQVAYERLLGKLGAELHILKHAPLEDIRRSGSTLVAEAVARMRAGKVLRQAGYDGEYGVIRMFEPGELAPRALGSLFAHEQPQRPGWSVPDGVEHELRGADRPAAEDAKQPSDAASEAAGAGAPGVPASAPSLARAGSTAAALYASAAANSASVLAGLDPEQQAAASITEGPLLIIAGPGTGKTRTLTHRIAHLVRERGVAPASCLAITFTRRAAEELRERLATLLGASARDVDVFTFHGLGASILRAHADRVELPSDFRVASEAERVALLREALDLSARAAQRLLPQLSRLKRTRAAAAPGSELAQAEAAYERHLRARGAVDFDDLVRLPVELLERDPELAAHYARRYAHVSIDEYQDIDELQYRLVRLLAAPAASLCAIGDPDQAIYGFRGADVGFFVHFERDFPGARRVQLTRNYRSGPTIVAAAMHVIRACSLVPDRALHAQGGAPLELVVHDAENEQAEAEFIVGRIESLVGGYDFHAIDAGRIESGDGHGLAFSDFAVLYRTARQLDALERALSRAGIPFQQRSHERLCDHPWVQAVLQALPGAGTGTVLERVRAAGATLGEVPPEQRLVLIELLSPLAERAGTDCERFVADVSAGAEIDAWDPRAARVALLTLHAAKGLEFECVFIAGCEDGLLPLSFGPRAARSKDGPQAEVPGESPAARELDEERRLLFVGMTRARRRLVLTRARRRTWLGQVRDCAPSPFLEDIASELVALTRSDAPRPRPARRQLDLF